MAEQVTLEVHKRAGHGKWAMRRLRAQGVVPGVLYGHGEEAVAVQLQTRDLLGLIRRGARLVELTGEIGPTTVLIRDLQWDPFGADVLHVDFARVAADERIEVEVPIVVRGTAPGIEQGGVLSQLVHTVEVECLVTEIPKEIRVDVRGLQLDQAIHVSQLVVPPGVKVLADPDVVVVQVTKKMEEMPAAAEVVVAGPAEPEIVGRRVAEEPAEEPGK